MALHASTHSSETMTSLIRSREQTDHSWPSGHTAQKSVPVASSHWKTYLTLCRHTHLHNASTRAIKTGFSSIQYDVDICNNIRGFFRRHHYTSMYQDTLTAYRITHFDSVSHRTPSSSNIVGNAGAQTTRPSYITTACDADTV